LYLFPHCDITVLRVLHVVLRFTFNNAVNVAYNEQSNLRTGESHAHPVHRLQKPNITIAIAPYQAQQHKVILFALVIINRRHAHIQR
jgi:hypothetical protein